jgi:hypothetical protein
MMVPVTAPMHPVPPQSASSASPTSVGERVHPEVKLESMIATSSQSARCHLRRRCVG